MINMNRLIWFIIGVLLATTAAVNFIQSGLILSFNQCINDMMCNITQVLLLPEENRK